MAKHLVQHNLNFPSTGVQPIEAFNNGLTKKQIAQMAELTVEMVVEEGSVFKVAEALAAMDEFVKTIRKDDRFIDLIRDELLKHHGRMKTASGARIEMYEAGVHYDYSENPEWRELDNEMRILSERKKAVEENLRKLAPGKMIVDPETGEVTEGALKSSRSTYRITLAK
jgi:hypothetical protein